MKSILSIIGKIIYWMAICFICISIYTLTIAQDLGYEFTDWQLSRIIYDYVMQGLPFAILLTLTGTLKRTNKNNKIIIALTISASICSFLIIASLVFTIGFLTITNDEMLFKQKSSTNITIMTQTIGQGALGEDGHRIVKLEPFLYFWNKVTIIDTSKINKTEWIPVNKKSSK